MSIPLIPPRPSRTAATTTTTNGSLPEVPPRPFRKLDPSPSRETRSPLNELPNPMGSLMPKKRSQNNLHTLDVPPRPSIQTIPSIGQEGSEYASFDILPAEAHVVKSTQLDAPEQTRNVSASMPLHAPKASFAQSTAKSRIETVTSTDSTQAAAIGIGKAKPADDVHKVPADSAGSLSRVTTKADDVNRIPSTEPHLKPRTSFSHSPSLHQATSRPGSMFNEGNQELGIPEIGMQIPLNPNAGDVQAPSPAPIQSQFAPGIGFFNDGSARAHVRRKSSRQEFGPPGSYGLHSHGQEPHDHFEREWVAKNPDRAALEGSHSYGTPRPETALTIAELNRLVNQSNDVGMGTDPTMIGTPGEEVAWGATDEYTTKWTSPKPSPLPTTGRRRLSSSDNLPAAQSPLRKTTSYGFPQRKASSEAIDADDDTIHIDPAERKWNKVTGGGAVDGTLDLGPRGGNTEERGGIFDEQGYGTPILASDEVTKRPGSAYMQPAVDPEVERHDDESDQYDNSNHNSRRSSIRVPSRPSSRPNSVHGEYSGGNLYRFISHDEHHGSGLHTPLEEIEEYEPLIPEGDEEPPKPKPKSKKRPGLENHHFPSQDIWEDTPSSLQYQTTVDTPEPPFEAMVAPAPASSKSTAFETPEQEEQRKAQNSDNMFSDNKTFIKPALRDEMRPGMHRFPSQDIWEDTPDSMMGLTTVSGPQMEEVRSPPEDRPTTAGQEEGDTRATTGFTQTRRPSIPVRPLRKSRLAEELKPDDPDEPPESTSRDISDATAQEPPSPEKSKPALPDRPKPSVPPRPAKSAREVQADGVELAKSISPEDGPPVNKPKPPVPARPQGEKIAALKAGFMSDLNNRLKLGPQGPPPKAKEPESEIAEETTRAPLADARKGRAKGPARRKPAASPSASEEKPATFSFSSMVTVWEIDETDQVKVPSVNVTDADAPAVSALDIPQLAQEMAANEAANTAEPTMAEPMSPEKAESMSPPPLEPISSIDQASEVQSLEQQLVQAQARASIGGAKEQNTTEEVQERELVPAASDAVEVEEDISGPQDAPVDIAKGVSVAEHTAPETETDVSVTDHADVMEEHQATEMAKAAD